MNSFVVTPVGPSILPEHLAQCLDSVRSLEHPATHVLVFDGPGPFVPLENQLSIRLPVNVRDIGSTPRTIGACYAWGLGADSVSFLDADCMVKPDHLTRAIRHHKLTGKEIICSGREILHYDGKLRGPCPEMDPADGRFFDTNTFTFFRDAIGISYAYGTLTGYEQHKIGDRILSEKAHACIACHYHPTVVYRTVHEFHYKHFSWPRPEGVAIKNLATDENTR